MCMKSDLRACGAYQRTKPTIVHVKKGRDKYICASKTRFNSIQFFFIVCMRCA